ncbi:zinc finger CCCH domain-containing protein 24-like [Zingiber officinale]|uniref:C3H1-type domain-containing protein n=1 Tax=Zingiber officinale TaxID=94328 RepID=A0A8J5HT55_ZINOF|nr:zinc finger CCCH domain-containing protein 24-like [Zingiber officinale]XP_042426312.1 zinc finger CCCH domain-containing protein 24-like [Zingiber officinale]KAG6535061.1 hypothetical protein ZIOFF_000015 [Zingiber officinale]
MCGVPERMRPCLSSTLQEEKEKKNIDIGSGSPAAVRMTSIAADTDEPFMTVLELAANNDVAAFKRTIDRAPSCFDEVGLWYGRKRGSNRMAFAHRTPLMVAATYGSLDVLEFLLSLPTSVVINRASGQDGYTALHCSASGGSPNAARVVKLLLSAGADPNLVDSNGDMPADVIVVSPKLPDGRAALEALLGKSSNDTSVEDRGLREITAVFNSDSPPLSSSPDAAGSPSSGSVSSPMMTVKVPEIQPNATSEKKEYPFDPSLPDIKNSIYATDEFRMYSFKVRPCSRAYSHDWTECPFVHPGENARRRDPRKYHYSCVPCTDFRKGVCKRGDMCEYAHGVFECWLHPAQYRTKLCKDGTACVRRVCFFAHTNEELRPLYMSTGPAILSPLSSSAAIEMAAAMTLMPGSPGAVMPCFTPPISPSVNGIEHSSMTWAQPNLPLLHLPGSNLQASRLRSSISARDMPLDDFSVMPESNSHPMLMGPSHSRLHSSLGGQMPRSKILTPSNLDHLFAVEITSSPNYSSDQGNVFSPSNRTVILNQFHQQRQCSLSPINTLYATRAIDNQQLPGHSSLVQPSLGVPSSGSMSPRSMEPVSPMLSHLPFLALRKKHQEAALHDLSPHGVGSITSPVVDSAAKSSWSDWASPRRAIDWGVSHEELGLLRQSSSLGLQGNNEEPDLSWIHSLVKEPPPEKMLNASARLAGPSLLLPANGAEVTNSDYQYDILDQADGLCDWLKHCQLGRS